MANISASLGGHATLAMTHAPDWMNKGTSPIQHLCQCLTFDARLLTEITLLYLGIYFKRNDLPTEILNPHIPQTARWAMTKKDLRRSRKRRCRRRERAPP